MDRPTSLLGLGLGALLAGCGERQAAPQDGPARPALEQRDESARVDSEPDTPVTLGPLRFEYNNTRLTLAEVPITLPPDYDDEAWAIKLIPGERAQLLGQEGCRYGMSGLAETCNAADEIGLLLALLERPVADYRQAFLADDLQDSLEPAQISGAQGFSFTAQAEGSGIEYRFVPLDERTLLVARQFANGDDAGDEAIKDVIDSVAQEVADLSG